jgi:hypothetical protein
MKDILAPFAAALATTVAGMLTYWLGSERLTRTIDQTNKVMDFITRWFEAYDQLKKVPENRRGDVEKLMLHAMEAVQRVFAAEQVGAQEPEKVISSFRSALLLHSPKYRTLWLPYLVFYTLLLFIIYLVVLRTIEMTGGQLSWSSEDLVAVAIACLCAVVIRWVVGPTLRPKS